MNNESKLSKGVTFFTILTILFFLFNSGFCQEDDGTRISGNAISNSAKQQDTEKDNAEIKFIGFVFRILAKGLITAADIGQLKINSIDKINKMDEGSFHARYLDIYEHLHDCHFFTSNYGLRENMTREEAIEKIRLLDRQKMYAIVDALPDTVIANEFKRYLYKNKMETPKADEIEKFFEVIKKMLGEIKRKYLGEGEINNGYTNRRTEAYIKKKR